MADALDFISRNGAGYDPTLAKAQIDQQQLEKFSKLDGKSSPEKLRKVADEFESVFMQMMISHMDKGIDTDGLFDGGEGEAAFRPMLHEQWAKAFTGRGGVGISDAVFTQMMRLQEVQP